MRREADRVAQEETVRESEDPWNRTQPGKHRAADPTVQEPTPGPAARSSTFRNPFAEDDAFYGTTVQEYMAHCASSMMRTGSGSAINVGSAPGMNQRINLKDISLERRDDLELLWETDVTEMAPFRTGGYDLYRTTLPGKYMIIADEDGLVVAPQTSHRPCHMTRLSTSVSDTATDRTSGNS